MGGFKVFTELYNQLIFPLDKLSLKYLILHIPPYIPFIVPDVMTVSLLYGITPGLEDTKSLLIKISKVDPS
jgi:hypothetical protein